MVTQPIVAESKSFAESVLEETGRRLWLPEDIDGDIAKHLPEKDARALRETLDWIRGFIMRPHMALGRPGVVCPYVKQAIDESLLYLSIGQPSDPMDHQTIYREMDLYRQIFKGFEPSEGPSANLRCILVLFPETPESVFCDPPGLKTLKSRMMEHGITIGQFYPKSDPKKFLKDKFFPVQTPVPLYVMRPFADFDWVFIKGEAEWRKIYKQKFGAIPKKWYSVV